MNNTDLDHRPDMEAAQAWFLRLQADPENPQLRADFKAWKDAAPEREACYLEILLLWDSLGQLPALQQYPAESDAGSEAGVEMAPWPGADPSRQSRGNRFGFAAGLAGIAMMLGLLHTFTGPGADYEADTGERLTVSLTDGSTLWLNAGSAVNVRITGEERQLELLHGEAYFEVASDPRRPFVVTAKGMETRALGTAFNVRIDAQTVATRLIEGRVEVSVPSGGVRQMVAGERVSWQPAQPLKLSSAKVSLRQPAWTKNLLRLDEQPLHRVVEELNRQYPDIIRVTDSRLAEVRISGTLPLDDMDTVLDMLRSTLAIQNTRIRLGDRHGIILLHQRL